MPVTSCRRTPATGWAGSSRTSCAAEGAGSERSAPSGFGTLVGSLQAYAAGLTVLDGTADVWESADQGEYVASAQVENVDVESLRVRHLANRIVVSASYVELLKDAEVTLVVSSVLRFDDGPAVTIMVDTFQKASGESVLYTRRGPVDCGGFDATIDYAADTVELVVPRTCVGTPRWVEANYVALGNVEVESEDGPTYTNYRDNVLTTGSGAGGWTERVRRG